MIACIPMPLTASATKHEKYTITASLGHRKFWPTSASSIPSALFVTTGRDTPAPWAPPQRLVVRDFYRHVRNPMIMGVLLMLGAESL